MDKKSIIKTKRINRLKKQRHMSKVMQKRRMSVLLNSEKVLSASSVIKKDTRRLNAKREIQLTLINLNLKKRQRSSK